MHTVNSAERALTLDVPLDILDDEAVSPTTKHAQSPLRFVNNNQWTPQWEYEVVEALQLAQQGAEAIERSGADLARLLGLGDLGNDAHTLAQWVVMARVLPEAWPESWG